MGHMLPERKIVILLIWYSSCISTKTQVKLHLVCNIWQCKNHTDLIVWKFFLLFGQKFNHFKICTTNFANFSHDLASLWVSPNICMPTYWSKKCIKTLQESIFCVQMYTSTLYNITSFHVLMTDKITFNSIL